MRFLVLGNSEFALRCTQGLLEAGSDVCALVSMPADARPNNSADTCKFADEHNIPLHEISDINSSESVRLLKSLAPEYLFCEWPSLLSREVLGVPQYGSIGTHPTDLPHNRGRHPLHWMICLGIQSTQLSFFMLDEGIDTGDILLKVPFTISPEDTIADAVRTMNEAAYEGALRLCREILVENTCNGIKQSHEDANYWRRRTPHDVTLDPRMSAESVIRTVRSFTTPYPCANLVIGEHVLKILDASVARFDGSSDQLQRIEPGRILAINDHTIRLKVADEVIDLKCVAKIPKGIRKSRHVHPPTMYVENGVSIA